MKKLAIFAITFGLTLSLTSLASAESGKSKKKDNRSESEKLSDDYRMRRDRGDTSLQHAYQPCRDGGRCGSWGYGYGYGGYYGGGYYGNSSPGWSRSYWRGSDIPTTGYHYYRGR
jgi:hypothetical protein